MCCMADYIQPAQERAPSNVDWHDGRIENQEPLCGKRLTPFYLRMFLEENFCTECSRKINDNAGVFLEGNMSVRPPRCRELLGYNDTPNGPVTAASRISL